ncbi:MAG: cation transporter, partial [Chloroflexota bacterium]
TTTMRLGTCVTNPATREPSVTASTLAVLDELQACLLHDFAVEHTTFQIEPAAHVEHEAGGHG